jgi:hypothetical protein
VSSTSIFTGWVGACEVDTEEAEQIEGAAPWREKF